MDLTVHARAAIPSQTAIPFSSRFRACSRVNAHETEAALFNLVGGHFGGLHTEHAV